MKCSIAAALDAGGAKSYLRSLKDHGFEMGVGHQGTYDAHAHAGFTDLAFAPGGIRLHHTAEPLSGRLHLSSPGSWFGPIEFLSDFWFAKFFESARSVCPVPDKITDLAEVAREGCLVAWDLHATLNLHHPGVGDRELVFRTSESSLTVTGLDGLGSVLRVVS